LSHIWQRFLLTSSLLVGFAVGVASTVFGYSNLTSVDVRWSVFHINGVPLWTVALVPVALTIAAGAVYHWIDSLHHFTEHMRHRHRVHELEAELGALRAHLDQVLEMPDHAGVAANQQKKSAARVSLSSPEDKAQPQPVPAEVAPEPVSPHPEPETPLRKSERRKRVRLTVSPQPTAEQANGADATGTDLPAKPNPEA
jgi:hypothetical protein